MSDYYECPECGDNQFMLEWGRIECSKNGHGVPDGWPSASKKAGMDPLHELALALDEVLSIKAEHSSFINATFHSMALVVISKDHDTALALDLLRDLEWDGHIYDESACPDCSAARYQIIGESPEPLAKDCRLASMIGAKVKK